MSEEKVLTKEIADEIIIKENIITFVISAEIVKDRLMINGLIKLSDAAAESLSKFQGFLELTDQTIR